MNYFGLDSIIFVAFLTANLIFGLLYGRNIKSIKEYAIGDRKFSTATIVSTLVATWISGNYFFTMSSEVVSEGLYFIWGATLSDLVCFLAIALFFAPRMTEFLGKLSVAEAMGDLFGQKVRMLTAISSFVGITGIISIELKAAGMLFEAALDMPPYYGTILAGIIVTIYSALGGVKSVTFTDMIQFLTFGIVIPVVLYYLLSNIQNFSIITDVVTNNESYDYRKVFDFSNEKSLYFLFLFLFSAIPGFSPALFQRISMSSSPFQVYKSFSIAAFTCFMLGITICIISILTIATHPNIASNDVFKTILEDFSHITGLKGLIMLGIMAMIMSTVDSFINSTSVIVTHDFLKPLGFNPSFGELFTARIVSTVIGIVSIVLALRENTFLNILITSYSFYMPVVTVPFIMAVFGFRSSEKSVISGMIAGFVTVLVWDYFDIQIVENIIPAMGANLLVLFSAHYLFKQKGGWVGIEDTTYLEKSRLNRKAFYQDLWCEIKNFDLLRILQNNQLKGEGFISVMGVFVMISTFSSYSTLGFDAKKSVEVLLDIFYPIAMASATALISYPLWLDQWKKTKAISIIWGIVMQLILVSLSFFMVLLSNLNEIQIMTFMMNILVISALTSWRWALTNIVFGISLVSSCFLYFNLGNGVLLIAEFKIVYLLLLIISSLLLFLKPRQAYQEKLELKSNYLSSELENKINELKASEELKYEFLRNIEHESHTPITSITCMGQILFENYNKFSESEKYELIKDIADSSQKLQSMVDNLTNLSKLQISGQKIKKSTLDFTSLVQNRLNICKKLYLEKDSSYSFDIKIPKNISVTGNSEYLASAIDALIINAIQYSKDGLIRIRISAEKDIEFTIEDEGVGIPEEELTSIFTPFMIGSRTKTPASGRGVGLSLAKKIIELHKGKIWARNNPEKGSTFIFVIPKK